LGRAGAVLAARLGHALPEPSPVKDCSSSKDMTDEPAATAKATLATDGTSSEFSPLGIEATSCLSKRTLATAAINDNQPIFC
jgi:hypothetical protein